MATACFSNWPSLLNGMKTAVNRAVIYYSEALRRLEKFEYLYYLNHPYQTILFHWLVGWLVGWLAGWLVGSTTTSFSLSQQYYEEANSISK